MRANVKIVMYFEDFENLIDTESKGTRPRVNIVGAECNNDTGTITLSAVDPTSKPLGKAQLATAVWLDEYAPRPKTSPRESVHKCIHTPDGYIMRITPETGDWEWGLFNPTGYTHIIEFCPFCGQKLEV